MGKRPKGKDKLEPTEIKLQNEKTPIVKPLGRLIAVVKPYREDYEQIDGTREVKIQSNRDAPGHLQPPVNAIPS